MCEWHQLVYLAIIIVNKPTALPDFRCISPFVLATKPKMPSFRPKNYTENYTYLSSICKPNICSKMKIYIYSNPQGQTYLTDWQFFSQRFSRAFHQLLLVCSLRGTKSLISSTYLKLPHSRPQRILGNSAIARA